VEEEGIREQKERGTHPPLADESDAWFVKGNGISRHFTSHRFTLDDV
jgi:hypothetical protein